MEAEEWVSGIPWPEPKVVDPGPVGGPPSDAIVLFDGKDLSQWEGGDKWHVKDGYAIAAGNDIHTKQAFGDCQLHVEWATPEKVEGHGQERGNSGVFMMGLYEIQILDSYDNPTYFDGQAAAIYKQRPPLVNACRKPGQWQTYDIVFEAPRFDEQGKLVRPAFVTVLQNGVLVQNHIADSRHHVLGPAAEVHGPSGQVAAGAAVPRQSGPLPQHLDSRAAAGRCPAAGKSEVKRKVGDGSDNARIVACGYAKLTFYHSPRQAWAWHLRLLASTALLQSLSAGKAETRGRNGRTGRSRPAPAAHLARHVHLAALPVRHVLEPALPVNVPRPHVGGVHRQPDPLEAQLIGQVDARLHQFRADADVLKPRTDDHQHLAFLPVDGEQGGVADEGRKCPFFRRRQRRPSRLRPYAACLGPT